MADTPTVDNLVPKPIDASTNYLGGGMNYLQLLQRLRQECGVTGASPSTVQGLTGEMLRLAGYINEAWLSIQRLHPDWEFMRQPVAFITQAGSQKYSVTQMQISSFSNYDLDTFSVASIDTDDDEQPMVYLHYKLFREMYMFGPRRTTTGRPLAFTLNGQKDFLIGLIPDKQYNIRGEGWVMPTELVNDSDRPSMPGQHHMAIIHRAMVLYGMYEAAPEVLSRGQVAWNESGAALANDQLPEIVHGAPLA